MTESRWISVHAGSTWRITIGLLHIELSQTEYGNISAPWKFRINGQPSTQHYNTRQEAQSDALKTAKTKLDQTIKAFSRLD